MTEHRQQHGPAAPEPADGHAAAPEAPPRCPSCGAVRPPAVSWCTQCYARLDAPGDPSVPPAETGARGDEPHLGPSEPTPTGTPVAAATPEEVEARAQELLARLAGERDDARVRSWSGLVQGTGQKVTAMVVGTLVLTGVLFGAMAVLGALL